MKKQRDKKFKVMGSITAETKIFGTTYGKFKKILEKEFKKIFEHQTPNSKQRDN